MPALPHWLRRGVAVLVTLVMIATISPAAHAQKPPWEVDLGPVSTLADVLASPEYHHDHAEVLRLYIAFFRRQPDADGAAYWIDHYEEGLSFDDLAWNFANSDEFQNTYGRWLSNEAFLEVMYANVLGRIPDQAGFEYWLAEMNRDLGQHGVVRWVVANPEFAHRHPYHPTSPDLRGVLLDLPAIHQSSLYSLHSLHRDSGVSDPAPPALFRGTPDACHNQLIVPRTVTRRVLEDDDDDDWYFALVQLIYRYSTLDRAQAYMDWLLSTVQVCPTYLDVNGYRVQRRIVSQQVTGHGQQLHIHEVIDVMGWLDVHQSILVEQRGRTVLISGTASPFIDLGDALPGVNEMSQQRLAALLPNG